MKKILMLGFILALADVTALAQDQDSTPPRRFGLTFPNIGVIWHITNNIAFIPEINLAHGWATFTSDPTSEYSNDTVGVNAALRFYIQEWKGLRLYLTPRYGYGWVGSDRTYAFTDINGVPVEQTITTRSHNHSIAGAWGVQYAISDRLSIFGDIGAKYARSSFGGTTYDVLPINSYQKNNTVSTVGTWGLIVYLK